MSCSVCQHSKRQEIDQALLAGSAALTDLSRKYGLSPSALQHHQAHLQVKMKQAGKQLQNVLLQTCCFWLSQALDMTMEVAAAAQAEKNYNLLFRAVSQGTRLITLINKQEIPLDDRLIYAISSSPQWAAQKVLLPDDPKLIALSRESLAGLFATPCPEEPPPASPEVMRSDTLPPVQSISLKPKVKNDNRNSKTKKRPSRSEESEGSWEDGCYMFDEEEQYRLLEVEKKLSGIDWAALIRGLPKDAARAKEEAIIEELWNSIPIPKDKPLSEYLYEQSLAAQEAT